MPPKKKVV